MDISNHGTPFSGAMWFHEPVLYVNSLGFGYCDDVANVLASILTDAGISARVWQLEGHIVCEALIDGDWVILDPDLQTLYADSSGKLVGVEYVASHPDEDWSNNIAKSRLGYLVDLSVAEFSYGSSVVNAIYATTYDNYVYNDAMIYEIKSNDFVFNPYSSAVLFKDTGNSVELINGDEIVSPFLMELTLKSGDEQVVTLPLALLKIEGRGSVIVKGITYEIGSESLNNLIGYRAQIFDGITIIPAEGDVKITYLVNSNLFDFSGENYLTWGNYEGAVYLDDDGGKAISLDGRAVIVGGDGDDVLRLHSTEVNGSEGSRLEGGAGNDLLVLDASQSYSETYILMFGGQGNDVIQVGLEEGQYTGSVQIEGGDGNDVIAIGHIQGSRHGYGYVDGGAGDDVISVSATLSGIGIWSNSRFRLLGGSGDDQFSIEGIVVNVLGDDQGVVLDGGDGFDTLYWTGLYHLTLGGQQSSETLSFNGYRGELDVRNIESIDLSKAAIANASLAFTSLDVHTITRGSDFELATLGLGLRGQGGILFVNVAGKGVLDLSGWNPVGGASVHGGDYMIYRSGDAYLGVLQDAPVTRPALASIDGDQLPHGYAASAILDSDATAAVFHGEDRETLVTDGSGAEAVPVRVADVNDGADPAGRANGSNEGMPASDDGDASIIQFPGEDPSAGRGPHDQIFVPDGLEDIAPAHDISKPDLVPTDFGHGF